MKYWDVASTGLRMAAGLSVLAAAAVMQLIILLVLLPSRLARVKSCIFFARFVGVCSLKILGCRMNVSGGEHLDSDRPAIYIVNHTSIVDLFVGMSLMPYRCVGIAKKEIVYYPFFGQIYLLSGHLRIDRGTRESAVASMNTLGELVQKGKLSILMSPEGTRSRDGRLLPFKKGFVHLAMQTGLPVVPIIIHGAHLSWRADSMAVHGVTVRVEVLPAIDTSGWTAETTGQAVEQIHAIYRGRLSADQLPENSVENDTGES